MNWEHQIAVAFVTWWAYAHKAAGVDIRLLHAIPNGGHRHAAVAGKMKAEGVRAGVADYFLAVPRGDFHGLYLELKSGGPGIPRGKLSPEQKEFARLVSVQGYDFRVAHGTDEAVLAVQTYLGGTIHPPRNPSPF